MEKYPFIPKSTTFMREGHFWDIPLSNGQYACGRILQFDYSTGKKNSRSFLAGLIDWVGDNPPTYETIAGAGLLVQGFTHVITFVRNNWSIIGFRSLVEDHIEPITMLDQMPTKNCWIRKGYELIRLASIEERKSLFIQSTWGYSEIKIYAEAYFVTKKPPVPRLPWDELMDLRNGIGLMK